MKRTELHSADSRLIADRLLTVEYELYSLIHTTSRRRRTALSVSCPCLVFVRIFQEILSGVCLLSEFCPDFLSGVCLSGFCLSRICLLFGFCPEFKEKGCLVSLCLDFSYLYSVRWRDFVWIFRK